MDTFITIVYFVADYSIPQKVSLHLIVIVRGSTQSSCDCTEYVHMIVL